MMSGLFLPAPGIRCFQKPGTNRVNKVVFLRKAYDTFNNSELDSGDNVKGRLKKNVMFWEQLETNNYILDIINDGYRLPFLQIPREYISQNNKSAHENEEFVSKAIDELLQS